jgi:hypothetical protein
MRIMTGLLAIALLAAWGHVAPAAAQCTMWCPNGAAKAKTKPAKHAVAKKPKKQEIYMRAVPY